MFYLNDKVDAFIILAVLVFNASIGALQEGRSQKTMRSLKKLSEAESLILRDGKEEMVSEKEIVLGDILLLQEGEKITADARIIFSSNLNVDESALTGESGAVLKKDVSISAETVLPASGQHNMVFKGTVVLSGNAKAVVVGTGQNTEIGKISKALLEPETEIPLQRNIKKLSRLIIISVLVISLGLFLLGVSVGKPVEEIFAVVVSMAVSMIPEGLPLVLTLILVSGVWRMSKKNALVKKLQAVEALGHANILAVDKTGTITKNEMIIKKLFLSGKIYQVSGSGYEPKGGVSLANQVQDKSLGDFGFSATIASLVSRAKVVYMESEGVFRVSGDPTEAAMTVFAEKFSKSKEELLKSYKEVAEINFDHKNKYHAIFYEHEENIFAAIAGAPESLLVFSEHVLENGHRGSC
jgi:Ca2+-transporting ATPase